MPLPIDYFARVERHKIRSVEDFEEFVKKVGQSVDGEFVWRGVHDACFAMHSSLYRRVSESLGHYANERELRNTERLIFIEASRDWSLLPPNGALQLLAELQHTGTPTRLLDFSTDPLIALWFAVEQRRDPITRRVLLDRPDGRVFAVQAGQDIPKGWEESRVPPWWLKSEGGKGTPNDWNKTVYVWKPSSASIRRIKNQKGVLLIGGVPGIIPINTEEDGDSRPLALDETRACTSLAVRINKATRLDGERRGRPTKAPLAFTCRIPAARKRAIREELQSRNSSAFTHGFIYQDHAGFAEFSSEIPLI